MTTAPDQPVRLWRRTTKRGQWKLVATYPTVAAAWDAMQGGGDWLVRTDDRDPNAKAERPTY